MQGSGHLRATGGRGHEGGTEHRFLSILFCDLVDSTGHQFRMDPEAFEALLGAYRHAAFACIRAHGGHVARVVGDGILALFGWPRAQGGDAQEAVGCALEIGARIAALDGERRFGPDTTIAVRMAVETGWVLVGSIGPEGEAERDGVVGPAPNIAARLQRLARHNGVVAGEGTLPLLDARFSLEPADTRGIDLPLPVSAAHVTAMNTAADPLERLLGAHPSGLVGRKAELARLEALWQRARAGNGQAVLLSGEAGIGKSRLLGAFAARLDPARCARIAVFCAPQTADSVLHPLVEPLRAALGLAAEAGIEEVRVASRAFALRLGLLPPAGEALAALLGAPPPAMAPDELRRWTFEALLAWIAGTAHGQPLLLLVEDAHWADPSLAAFLRRLAEEAPRLPLLLVISFRADRPIAWPAALPCTRLAVAPLAPAEAGALAEAAAGGLPPGLRAEIVARAEGVPLFVEEFARALRERSATAERLPGSLSQLLAARLDALGPARGLVQIAAAAGQSISLPLLRELAGLPPARLAEDVETLVRSGVMVRRPAGREAVLAFRHMLFAEAAYQALPGARRRQMHAAMAAALERLDPALATSAPAILARHREAAGEASLAATLFCRAAANALATGAYREAETWARHVVRLSNGDNPAAQRPLLAGLVHLGDALIASQGYAAPEVQEVFERATQVALAAGEAVDLIPVLRGLTAFHEVRGPLARAEEVGTRLLRLAQRAGDPADLADAECREGWRLLWSGRLAEAGAALDRAAAARAGASAAQVASLPADPAVLAAAEAALLAWLTGNDATALHAARVAAERATAAHQPLAMAGGLGLAAMVHQLAGDWPGTLGLARRAGAIAAARGIAYWSAMAEMLEGWAQAMEGTGHAGRARIRHGLAAFRRTQGEVLRPYAHILLAEAEHAAGYDAPALAALDEALAAAEAIGAALYRPLLGWARARIVGAGGMHGGRAAAAGEARAQGAVGLAARIAGLAGQDERAGAPGPG